MIELETIYEVPAFVKEASATTLSPDQPGAIVIDGYRIDNPAAAWVSEATLRKQAMDNPQFSPSFAALKMLKQACDLFDLRDDMFILHKVAADHITVKTTAEEADFLIAGENDYNEAVEALLHKRASASYSFCKDCAQHLFDLGRVKGYELPAGRQDSLRKLAGIGHVDFARGAQEVRKRQHYANVRNMQKEAAVLHKLATICESTEDELIVPYVISALDEFDRGVKLLSKVAYEGMKYPEDAFYMTANETLTKQASSKIRVDAENTITRGALMKQANIDAIRDWANDCGYAVPDFPTPEDLVGVVQRMPNSLHKEFVDRFGNA